VAVAAGACVEVGPTVSVGVRPPQAESATAVSKKPMKIFLIMMLFLCSSGRFLFFGFDRSIQSRLKHDHL
jgi:hypothetical protein